MRIISGTLKGRSINFPKNSITRPLKDSVKENIFNILKHSSLIDVVLKNSNILDLYSGIGSFGLESISRGAKNVTFVEQDKSAVSILEENIIHLGVSNNATINNTKVENFLKNNKKKKFSIFFFDPPFSDKKFIQDLNLIKENKIYEAKHIIIIHRERESEDNFHNSLKMVATKQYGRSKILFGALN
ncbi:16S rRNA (guanine(966)-N(2))-methyltransferase RsmD [Pelagibacteraceae bacterium]|nr:16S rRNA (guanine(966)-N(2))-methyltransferase RsmD [Pelagibacteraceae bacterium]